MIGEIEEEQPHGFAERDGRDDQHQALDPQGRETDGAGNCAGDDSGGNKGRDQRPLRENGEHGGDIGADRKEAGLGEAHLAGEQHAIGRQPEQRVDADDLDQAEIEIHCVASLRQSRPAGAANIPPGRNTRNANRSSMSRDRAPTRRGRTGRCSRGRRR